MPAEAFDGSIWVAGSQILGLVGGTVALTGVGALLAARGYAKNQQLAPPPEYMRGRRKQPLIQQKSKKGDQLEPETIDAERLEDVLVKEGDAEARLEDALKEVSRKPRK